MIPEDDTLPRWDDIKHAYPKDYLDRRERRIADVLKRAAARQAQGR
jgi:hypothetical protein